MLSIIIPTLNEELYLPNLLKSLTAQSFKDYEIIIADNNSKDRTTEIAKANGAKVTKGGIHATGRNNGAKVSKGDIYVFMDADISFDRDFLEKGLLSFKQRNLDLACCYFDIGGLSLKTSKLTHLVWNLGKFIRARTIAPNGEGQCIWITKECFNSIGGFNEKLVLREDIDLLHRATRKGFKFGMLEVRYLPSERRFARIGTTRIMLATFIAGMFGIFGIKIFQKTLEKIYGGWGKH